MALMDTQFEPKTQIDAKADDVCVDSPSQLGDSVFYQIRDVNRTYMKHLQDRLAEHQVSIGQWFFLLALWKKDGITQRELSSCVGTMEPTTVTAIQGMERANLVKRVRDPQDRRKMNVFLTQRGQELETPLKQVEQDISEKVLEGLSADNLDMLKTVLAKVQQNLVKAQPKY